MTEAHRLSLFLIWQNWFELMTRAVLAARVVPWRNPGQGNQLMSEVLLEWKVPEELEIAEAERLLVLRRLLWGWTAVRHAQESGLLPPEQPLLAWRLDLLMWKWWIQGNGQKHVLVEGSEDTPLPSAPGLPAMLHEPLRLWWPCLLRRTPPRR